VQGLRRPESKEKEHLERELGEKDTKIKQLSGTAWKLKFKLASRGTSWIAWSS
jgi:hypothetical protein